MRAKDFPIILAVLLSGCVASGELPEHSQTGSVVEYTESLINSTTARNLDRLIDTTKDGEGDGYRWLNGWWCPSHTEVEEVQHVKSEYAALCAARGGVYDLKQFCMKNPDPDDILFMAKVYESNECSAGTTIALNIIEPTGSITHPGYLARLRKFGYETGDERMARLRRDVERQKTAELAAERQREQQAIEAQARKAALLQSIEGTRICKSGTIDYVFDPGMVSNRSRPGTLVGQLEGFSSDKERIQFRVLGYNVPTMDANKVPYTHSHRMGDFLAIPGTVYWDRTENWSICE